MFGKKKNKNQFTVYGLTLIELLLAITIFSIVASVIYSSLRLGIVSWRRTEANLSRYQKIRYAINSLSEDLANAFMHKDIPFKGEEKSIEFAGFIKDTDIEEATIGIFYKTEHDPRSIKLERSLCKEDAKRPLG